MDISVITASIIRRSTWRQAHQTIEQGVKGWTIDIHSSVDNYRVLAITRWYISTLQTEDPSNKVQFFEIYRVTTFPGRLELKSEDNWEEYHLIPGLYCDLKEPDRSAHDNWSSNPLSRQIDTANETSEDSLNAFVHRHSSHILCIVLASSM